MKFPSSKIASRNGQGARKTLVFCHMGFAGLRSEAPGDFAQQRGDVEQAQFQRGLNLLNPQFEQREQQLQEGIAQRGIPLTGEDASGQIERFESSRNQALENLALARTKQTLDPYKIINEKGQSMRREFEKKYIIDLDAEQETAI